MALGNLVLGTTTLTDTNDQGRYISASSTIVGERTQLVAAKPRTAIRTREDGTLTPQQGTTWNYTETTFNTTLEVFEQFSIQIQFLADSSVTSARVASVVGQIAALLNDANITKIRNQIR
jgi:hypothetical protein